MTNPTLERAARALYEFGMMADCPTWEQLEPRYKEDFFDMARAVLMSVREPDEAMKAAWLNAEMHGTESAWFLHRHKAMIDAILADGGE